MDQDTHELFVEISFMLLMLCECWCCCGCCCCGGGVIRKDDGDDLFDVVVVVNEIDREFWNCGTQLGGSVFLGPLLLCFKILGKSRCLGFGPSLELGVTDGIHCTQRAAVSAVRTTEYRT